MSFQKVEKGDGDNDGDDIIRIERRRVVATATRRLKADPKDDSDF